mgnify:CR=1 FL=1
MSWVRLDDTVPHHQKCLKAGASACWLWVCAVAYCQRHLTDGFVPVEAVPFLGVADDPTGLMERLCSVGLMVEAEGGYIVHDYHDHNATADEARERKQRVTSERSKSGRIGGIRSGIARRGIEATKQNGSNAEANARSKAEAPSHPIPILKNPPTPLGRGDGQPARLTRAERKHATDVKARRFGRCVHEPACESHQQCVERIAWDIRSRAS